MELKNFIIPKKKSSIYPTLFYLVHNMLLAKTQYEGLDNTYIDVDVEIGNDTVIEPNVKIFGKTTIGSECVIGSGSRISDSEIQDNVEVVNDVVESEETVIVEESTTTVSNQETPVIETVSEVVETTTTEPVEEKIENKPVIEEKKQQPKQETVKASAKKQQYDDWINSIK